MNFSRSNPVIDKIVADQKAHSAPGQSVTNYVSNIYDPARLLSVYDARHAAAGGRPLPSDPGQWSTALHAIEQAWITGEQFMTRMGDDLFRNRSICMTLETLDCQDRAAGITWRKSIFHRHDFFELIYVYRGGCTTTVSGQETTLSAGDICMYNLQAVHQIGIAGEEAAVFNLLIQKELFQQTFLQLQSGNNLVTDFFLHSLYHIQAPGKTLVFHPQPGGRCEMILQMMIEEFYQDRPLSQEFLKAMLSALFTELFHQHFDSIRSLNRQDPGAIDIAQVIEFIGSHYATVTLEETAAHFGYTTRSMIRFLKKHTNTTFRHIVQDFRLKQAAILLQGSSKSIQDIALEIGYSDRSYFHRLFQAHYGLTPAEYRQTLQKK